MENKLRSVLSGTGFYVLLAVCLIVAAVSGWFLLFGTDSAPEEEVPPPAAVSAPARDVYVPEPEDTGGPEDEPSAEVSAPAPVEVEIVPAMPEVPVDDTPVIAQEPRLVVEPLKGEVLMAFSVDQLVYSPTLADWRTHDGVDISAAPGSTVLAATSGTVASVEDDPMMGTTVTIDHEGATPPSTPTSRPSPRCCRGTWSPPGRSSARWAPPPPPRPPKAPTSTSPSPRTGKPWTPASSWAADLPEPRFCAGPAKGGACLFPVPMLCYVG